MHNSVHSANILRCLHSVQNPAKMPGKEDEDWWVLYAFFAFFYLVLQMCKKDKER